jgi:hypothetical protein
MMRDEIVSKLGQRHPGKRKLARDSVSAINDVRRAVREAYLCRWRVGLPWAWPTSRAKKYEPGPEVICVAACRRRGCSGQRGGIGQEPPPIDVYHDADPLPAQTTLSMFYDADNRVK